MSYQYILLLEHKILPKQPSFLGIGLYPVGFTPFGSFEADKNF